MKYAIVLAAGAALALGGCSSGDEPAADASETPAAEATQTAAASAGGAPAAGSAPSREYLVGKWGEGRDCELAMTFNADGSITDGPADNWTLEGNKLTLGSEFSMTLTVVDADTMASKNDGGGEATLKRCA